MNMPKVSVIIPTYNGSKLLGDAIQSVLGQTYSNFELIIINDASPDATSELVKKFHDPRINYIVHDKNQGVDQARCTGISASHGKIITFLDQDDFFHPEKLQSHVTFLEDHPEVGFSYNARFELDHSAKTIRDIWRPSRNIGLSDLVLWFPIAPSDWVLRRKWAFELLSVMASSNRWTGGEIVYLGHLFMMGCEFALVNRALNYRRHHSGRIFRNLSSGCDFEIAAQQEILGDSRCPSDVVALKYIAHANIYMFWAFRAFVQGETELGQDYVRRAIQLKPSILSGRPCELLMNLLTNCCDDENLDHSNLLKRVFMQLPEEASILLPHYEWARSQGYLIKGTRAIIWDRLGDAREYFRSAGNSKAEIDESFLSHLAQKLVDFEIEFSALSVQKLIKNLGQVFEIFGDPGKLRRLKAVYAVNRAYQSYHDGIYNKVPGWILMAIINDLRLIVNRGLFAILIYSVFKLGAEKGHRN